MVPKTGVVSDIPSALATKAPALFPPEILDILRLYEAQAGRIYRELPPTASVGPLSEWTTIYAQPVPPELVEAQNEDERAVSCFHFDRETSKTHSVPFRFVVRKDEVWSDAKERLRRRCGYSEKAMEKIKFAVVTRGVLGGRAEYLVDDDVVEEKLTTSDDQIGLDHVNKSKPVGGRGDVMMIR